MSANIDNSNNKPINSSINPQDLLTQGLESPTTSEIGKTVSLEKDNISQAAERELPDIYSTFTDDPQLPPANEDKLHDFFNKAGSFSFNQFDDLLGTTPSTDPETLVLPSSNPLLQELNNLAQEKAKSSQGMALEDKVNILKKAYTILNDPSLSTEEKSSLESFAHSVTNYAVSNGLTTIYDDPQELGINSKNPDIKQLGQDAISSATTGLTDQARDILMNRAIALLMQPDLAAVDAEQISNFINKLQLFKTANPQSADEIFKQLNEQVNTNQSGLSPQETEISVNYLKILAQALALFSRIKALIASMDAEGISKHGNAKSQNIKAETQAAMRAYENGIKKIKEFIRLQKKMKEMEKLGIIMKVIMALVIALMAAITAALMAASIMTGGTSAIAGIAMISAMTALSAYMIAETASDNFFTNQLCDAMRIKDPVLKSVISLVIMVAITILMALLTAGVGGAFMGAQLAATTGRSAGQVAVAAAKGAAEGVVKATVASVTRGVVGSVFVGLMGMSVLESGLPTQIFLKLAKSVFGMDDQEAMILSMILTLLLAILLMIGCAFMAGGVAGEGAAQTTSKTTTNAVGTSADDVASSSKAAGSGAQVGTSAAAGTTATTVSEAERMTNRIIEQATKFIKKCLENAVKAAKNILIAKGDNTAETVTQTIERFIKVVTNALQIWVASEQAKLYKDIADIEKAQGEAAYQIALANALLDFLKTMQPGFDKTIDGLQKDISKIMELGVTLNNMFMQIIDQLSKTQDQLVQASTRG